MDMAGNGRIKPCSFPIIGSFVIQVALALPLLSTSVLAFEQATTGAFMCGNYLSRNGSGACRGLTSILGAANDGRKITRAVYHKAVSPNLGDLRQIRNRGDERQVEGARCSVLETRYSLFESGPARHRERLEPNC